MSHSPSGVCSQPDSTHETLAPHRDRGSHSHHTEGARRHQALRTHYLKATLAIRATIGSQKEPP
jgi:hypothetical protein